MPRIAASVTLPRRGLPDDAGLYDEQMTSSRRTRVRASAEATGPIRLRRTGFFGAVPVRLTVQVLDFLIQLLLIVFGVIVVLSDNDEEIIGALLVWCAVGSAYWLLSTLRVAVLAYRDRRYVAHPAVRWIDLNPLTRTVTNLATFLASLVGVVAALELLFLRDDPDWAERVKIISVWAMLLSWALIHWGYVHMYARRYRQAYVKPLMFPGTDNPRLVDFFYFAYSIATTFGPSDVKITTTRMRWTVSWHSLFAFFLNALLIVLVINTIIR